MKQTLAIIFFSSEPELHVSDSLTDHTDQAWVKYIEYLYLVVFKYFFQYLYLYLYLNVSSRKYFVSVFKYIPIVFETTKIHSKYPASYYIRAIINLAVI